MKLSLEFDWGKKSQKSSTYSTGQPFKQGNTTFAPLTYNPLISTKNGIQNNDLMLFLFNNVAEVNSIITYIAQVASGVELEHVRKGKDGKEEEVKDSKILKLINKPNPLYSGLTLKLNAFSSFFVYGNIYINKVVPIGFKDVKELYLLPSNRVYIKTEKSTGDYGYIPTGTDPRQNPITAYNWDLGSKFVSLEPANVIHIKDSNLQTESGAYLYGQSRLFSATRNVSSISSMVDTINTILSKNGGLGFVKKNKKANEIDGGIDPMEKERIEAAFLNYGLTDGRQPIFFTDQDLQYVKMSSALSEFMPTQIKESEFRMLCNVLGGFPASILNDTASSTYNNLETAHKALYMNIVKPFVELFYEALSDGLGLTAMGEAIKPEFDDIEVLQPDKKLEAETGKLNDELQKQRYNDDLITFNEWLHEIGLEPVPGGDKKKSEMPTAERPIASDIGVGGVQALQAVLADPGLSTDSKVYTLVYVFGIDEPKARQMVGTNTQTV